ncbi:MAG: RES family NAD+ phosphorylase [Bacteroidota bacterium]
MTLYHLQKNKYSTVWPSEGTLFGKGRWNLPGQWIIYTSATLSLAKLEILANEPLVPVERVSVIIEIPDDEKAFEVPLEILPENWHKIPYPKVLTSYTQQFLSEGWLVMKVPSAQCFTEFNYLLNVRHPRFNSDVKVQSINPEPFDSRLKNN